MSGSSLIRVAWAEATRSDTAVSRDAVCDNCDILTGADVRGELTAGPSLVPGNNNNTPPSLVLPAAPLPFYWPGSGVESGEFY